VNLPQAVRRLAELDPSAFYWGTLRSSGQLDRQAFVMQAHSECIRVIDPEGEPLEELLEYEFAVLLTQVLEYVAARPMRCLTWATPHPEHPRLIHHAQIWPNDATPKALERQGRSLLHAVTAALIACLEAHGPTPAH